MKTGRAPIWFASLFVIAGVASSVGVVRMLQNEMASTAWPSVDGQVVSSEVQRKRSGSGADRSTTYGAEVYYEYVVGGVQHSSNKVSFGEYSSSNPGHARSIVNRYPRGQLVTVYFDPMKPQTSVLEPGVTWSSYALLGVGLVFTALGVGLLIYPKRQKTLASDTRHVPGLI